MFKRTVSADVLTRLKSEREEVDRRYNDALTELDRALQRMPDLPNPPPLPDDSLLARLNASWRLLPEHDLDVGQGWRAQFRRFVWSIVGPLLQQQQAFNASLVDHINRNATVHQETSRALVRLIDVCRGELGALVTFQAKLIQYVQQLTPYVDTKDREVAGLQRRINEDNAEMVDRLGDRTEGLAAGIGGVSDELQKRWESMQAREQRYELRVDELRNTLAVVHQASLTVKRELERLGPDGLRPPAPGRPVAVPGTGVRTSGRVRKTPPKTELETAPGRQPSTPDLDSYKYVAFEELFRGSQQDIRTRIAEYVPYFEGASDVLDVGCGRGEFLDLLRTSAVTARGLDINREMVEQCRLRGLSAEEGDALGYIGALPDASLGGLFAAQLVEHLEPDYLIRLLDVAYDKVRPGSKIILETINPACWFAFFESYIRDITHVRPLHPDTLRYLLIASGFHKIDILYRVPYPEHAKLQPVTIPQDTRGKGETLPRLGDMAAILNENVTKLNDLLFTHLDYAVIGERP